MSRMQIGQCVWCTMHSIWQINSLMDLVETFRKLPCVFRMFTGLYCPGCGGTRAVKALLRGQIGMSLYYHPFVLYLTVWIGFEVLVWLIHIIRRWSGKTDWWKERFLLRYRYWAIGGLAVILLNWIIKNGILIFWGLEWMP